MKTDSHDGVNRDRQDDGGRVEGKGTMIQGKNDQTGGQRGGN